MSKKCIIGCDDMRERNIDTSCYGYNRDPGIHKAVIDLMAEARKVGTLRVFLTFSDGRKIIVSVIQLQKMLNISRQLAYELINSGSINAVKVGNSYRIPKVSVIGYMLNAA